MQKENTEENARFSRRYNTIYTIEKAVFFHSLSRGKILRAIFLRVKLTRGNIKRCVRDLRARRAR